MRFVIAMASGRGANAPKVKDGIDVSLVAAPILAALGANGLDSLNGLTGAEALAIIRDGIVAMRSDPASYKAANAADGDAGLEAVLEALRRLRHWAMRNTSAIVKVDKL